MARNLDHDKWVRGQFAYLRDLYRDALLHASIIESILTSESGAGTFDSANKLLLCIGKTVAFEFCLFNEIREIRNKLVHRIFKKRLSSNQIDSLIKQLMEKIRDAYRKSTFLDNALFKKYNIPRGSTLAITPVSK
jgi:hypothetical protein